MDRSNADDFVDAVREIYRGVTWVKASPHSSFPRTKSSSIPIPQNIELRKRIAKRLALYAQGCKPARAFNIDSSPSQVIKLVDDDVLATKDNLKVFKSSDKRTFCVSWTGTSSVYIPASCAAEHLILELLPLVSVPEPITLTNGQVISALCALTNSRKVPTNTEPTQQGFKNAHKGRNHFAGLNDVNPAPSAFKKPKALCPVSDNIDYGYPSVLNKIVSRRPNFLVSATMQRIIQRRKIAQQPVVNRKDDEGASAGHPASKTASKPTNILPRTPILTFKIPKLSVMQNTSSDTSGWMKALASAKQTSVHHFKSSSDVRCPQISQNIGFTSEESTTLKRKTPDETLSELLTAFRNMRISDERAATSSSAVAASYSSSSSVSQKKKKVMRSAKTATPVKIPNHPPPTLNKTFFYRGDNIVVTKAAPGNVTTAELNRRATYANVAMAYKLKCKTLNSFRRYGKTKIRIHENKRIFKPKSKKVKALLAVDTSGRFPQDPLPKQHHPAMCHLCDCLNTTVMQCSKCCCHVCSNACLELHQDVLCPAH